MKLTWPINKYDDAVYQDKWWRCFYGSFLFGWSVEPGILLLQPRGWSGTGNGTFLSSQSCVAVFFPRFWKHCPPDWPSVKDNAYRIATAHLLISRILFVLFPRLDLLGISNRHCPKCFWRPPAPSPHQTGTMGSFFWTLFFPLGWTLWH